ncbi:hypothetical protein L195_g063539 [Trifolium pratense]|uniref:Uncharacterized protein n=1 Tax=Trifolium pratense TaxID=57577 RepID=A0A2K3KMK1_TRIPR|nr:hypothetical protein L195_g063539 [Trifolium pratense]
MKMPLIASPNLFQIVVASFCSNPPNIDSNSGIRSRIVSNTSRTLNNLSGDRLPKAIASAKFSS